MASTFSASAIVHVWIGSVKYQLISSPEATADITAGQIPPIAAMPTTSARYRRMTLDSDRCCRAVVRARVSSVRPMTPSTVPATRRFQVRPGEGGAARLPPDDDVS